LRLSNSFPVEVHGDGADEGNVIDKFEARRKLGIHYKGYLFLYLGIIRTDKGIEDLIKATSYLKNIDITIMIAGWPLDYTVDALNRIINKYGDKDKIITRFEYIPEDELSLYYSACDVLYFHITKPIQEGLVP
jgi:D-inositol-3-phosphate glycosyltransferase